MKPPPFEYVVAESVDGAVAALGRGDAKIIAGGQSLVPMLNFRLLRPAILVDINRVPGLARIEDSGDAIRVGARFAPHTPAHLPPCGGGRRRRRREGVLFPRAI